MAHDPRRAAEMTPVVSEVGDYAHSCGLDTRGCTCGHDGLGPDWHLDGCPAPTRMWRDKTLELARRLDQERARSRRLRSPAARKMAARAQLALDAKMGRDTPQWVHDIAETGHTKPR